MDWPLLVVLQVLFQPSLSVLFTVEAERSMYKSEFGGNVVMGCRFYPNPTHPDSDLKVTWYWISESVQEVIRIDNGEEHSASQKYQGRVKLLTEELKQGWAKLQISRLRIDDSGTYQCLVQTEEGADYKSINLSVEAPYTSVTKRIEKAAKGDEVLISCQAEGYPESSVVWQDGRMLKHIPNTTVVTTPDQLFKVTSQIQVSSSERNNYTCRFTKDGGSSAIVHIPDEIPTPHVKKDALIAILCIGVLIAIITVGVLTYRRRKGFRTPSTCSTKNLLVNGRDRSVSAAACLKIVIESENETATTINADPAEENLGLYLKAYYSESCLGTEVRRHCDAFSVKELPRSLQNNEGNPVNLQDLVPEAGETLFLEGPPGSGKTTVAHILVSSWTEGPTNALSNGLDLSVLHLLLHVNCSNVKGDLFQEITTQLSLTEKTSAEELRTVLTRSSKTLLLLDGYKEGNHFFDESLRRFLSERGGCRVLVMTCPGHCPTLKQTVGTGRVLKIQTQGYESL